MPQPAEARGPAEQVVERLAHEPPDYRCRMCDHAAVSVDLDSEATATDPVAHKNGQSRSKWALADTCREWRLLAAL